MLRSFRRANSQAKIAMPMAMISVMSLKKDSGPTPPDEAMRFLFDPFHELEPSAAELYMELPVVYQLVREFEGERDEGTAVEKLEGEEEEEDRVSRVTSAASRVSRSSAASIVARGCVLSSSAS